MNIITNKMKIEQLADACVGREHEVYSYQMNIKNYTLMLTDLPQGDWPTELVKYKSIEPSKIPADVDLATVMTINDYQYRDRLRILLRTENVEMNKTQRVLTAIDKQLPAATKNADVLAAAQRWDAELAKTQVV